LIQPASIISRITSAQGDIQDSQVATGTVKAILWVELPSAQPNSRLRANPEYINRARSKALVGNLADKHVAGYLGGAADSSPQRHAAQWMERCNGHSRVAMGGVITVKQMDEGE
jgi:hypothetical protein